MDITKISDTFAVSFRVRRVRHPVYKRVLLVIQPSLRSQPPRSRVSNESARVDFAIMTRVSRTPTSEYAHDSFVRMVTKNSTRGHGA